jgi:phospholipid/cholesterol/gamma-HCH transport system substrate-binding protein
MRDNRINYVMVGSFVLAMIVVLVVVIAVVSGRSGATDTYYADYDNVAGLKHGTKVLYEGFGIGQVEDIEPQQELGKLSFKVRLSVTHGWRIPDDSVARIAASGLLAAVALDIKGGSSPTALSPGSDIKSQSGGNLFAAMADIASQVSVIGRSGLPMLAALNHAISAVAPMLEEKAPQLLENLVTLSGDLAEKTPRISTNVEQATQGLNRVLRDDNTRKVDDIIGNADRTAANLADLTGSLQSSKAKVDQLLATLDRMASSNSDTVNQSLRDLRYTLQAVARNIDSVTYNLEGTARNMNEFSRQIRQDPGVLLGVGRPGAESGPR